MSVLIESNEWPLAYGASLVTMHRRERELKRVVLPAIQGEFDREAALIFGSSGRTQEFMQGYEAQAAFDPMPDLFIGMISQWMETFSGRSELLTMTPITRAARAPDSRADDTTGVS